MIFKTEFQILLNLKHFTDVYSYYRYEKKKQFNKYSIFYLKNKQILFNRPQDVFFLPSSFPWNRCIIFNIPDVGCTRATVNTKSRYHGLSILQFCYTFGYGYKTVEFNNYSKVREVFYPCYLGFIHVLMLHVQMNSLVLNYK